MSKEVLDSAIFALKYTALWIATFYILLWLWVTSVYAYNSFIPIDRYITYDIEAQDIYEWEEEQLVILIRNVHKALIADFYVKTFCWDEGGIDYNAKWNRQTLWTLLTPTEWIQFVEYDRDIAERDYPVWNCATQLQAFVYLGGVRRELPFVRSDFKVLPKE